MQVSGQLHAPVTLSSTRYPPVGGWGAPETIWTWWQRKKNPCSAESKPGHPARKLTELARVTFLYPWRYVPVARTIHILSSLLKNVRRNAVERDAKFRVMRTDAPLWWPKSGATACTTGLWTGSHVAVKQRLWFQVKFRPALGPN
jgi:hypothetical protein